VLRFHLALHWLALVVELITRRAVTKPQVVELTQLHAGLLSVLYNEKPEVSKGFQIGLDFYHVLPRRHALVLAVSNPEVPFAGAHLNPLLIDQC